MKIYVITRVYLYHECSNGDEEPGYCCHETQTAELVGTWSNRAKAEKALKDLRAERYNNYDYSLHESELID